jgi:hypothetical protein
MSKFTGEFLGKQYDLYRTQLFTFISGPTLAIGGNHIQPASLSWNVNSWGGVIFFIGTVTLIASIYYSYKDSTSGSELRARNSELEAMVRSHANYYYAEWEPFAKAVFDAAGLNDRCRVTLYRHDFSADAFFIIARYSTNPTFKKRGRSHFPADQGCIGEAWRNGEASDLNMPSPTNRPIYDAHQLSKWRIPENVVDKLTMRPQSIWAYALDSAGDRFGIVVIESIRKRDLQPAILKRLFDDGLKSEASIRHDTLKNVWPSCEYARRMGL